MFETKTRKEKIKQLLYVMWPLLVTQLGLYAMNFIDTTMSGQAGAQDLAGVAIGSSLWIPILTGISGILIALTPILSQKIGSKKVEDVPYYVLQTIYLSIALSSLVIVAGIFFLDPILAIMSLEPEVAHIAKHYLIGLTIGIFPLFIYNSIRGFIDSLGQTRTAMIITLIALPINALLNYVLIFGKAGFPALGGIGAGYATALTYWFILFVTLYFVMKVDPFRSFGIFKNWFPIHLRTWKELLFLGLPIGMTIFLETSIFSAVTLLMSQFSTAVIGAHQAAINFASLLYMIPLSFATTLTIAVGFEIGAKRASDAKSYAKIGMAFSVLMGVFASVFIFVLRPYVAQLYTNDPEVAFWIQQFLIYAIFFQLSDAINTPIQGILRGYKDVNTPFVMALISFWLIGLPFGYIMATFTEMGPFGYWLGLIAALALCATFLSFRLLKVQRDFANHRVLP